MRSSRGPSHVQRYLGNRVLRSIVQQETLQRTDPASGVEFAQLPIHALLANINPGIIRTSDRRATGHNSPRSPTHGAATPLQRVVAFNGNTKALYQDLTSPPTYVHNRAQVDKLKAVISVSESVFTDPNTMGEFQWISDEAGTVKIKKLPNEAPSKEFHARVGALAHEFQHALDQFEGKIFDQPTANALQIRTEWRAWAIQAAVAKQHESLKRPLSESDQALVKTFEASLANPATILADDSWVMKKTTRYLHIVDQPPNITAAQTYGKKRMKWLDEAIGLYKLERDRPLEG